MKFIGIKETAETTKQLRGHTWGPRVEIRYTVRYEVNNETSEVEVYGAWHMTDSEFGAWEEGWKYVGTTKCPMSQKEIKNLVLCAIELEQNEDK